MSDALYSQAVAATVGLLLLTTVLQVWRRSVTATARLLALQGVALAGLVATIAVADRAPELLVVVALVVVVKAVALPMLLTRTIATTEAAREDHPGVNPVSGLLTLAALTLIAYLASPPLVALGSEPAADAVPVGLALVLIGFWLLITRRRAVSQVIGFLVIDNGIATVAFLTAGGLPLVVELGVSLDVVLVVLILRILTARIHVSGGPVDLHDLEELRD